ncbi:hypothetical protein SAMN05192539_101063 [Paraburkholderia diazotrophica]|uniref:Uncharacterized protein n=1 Tax=Paraburkholderia diazotrophica TaxID=667676 RepID=A0A1H6YC22_9BURK|nr:hypothetical protein SAMN05192539_101063 [Paraburkholderia diazotrophica]
MKQNVTDSAQGSTAHFPSRRMFFQKHTLRSHTVLQALIVACASYGMTLAFQVPDNDDPSWD